MERGLQVEICGWGRGESEESPLWGEQKPHEPSGCKEEHPEPLSTVQSLIKMQIML